MCAALSGLGGYQVDNQVFGIIYAKGLDFGGVAVGWEVRKEDVVVFLD